jgi:ribosome-interacting GTPase 1
VYLKEPKKPASDKPLIMKPDSNVKDVAEKIMKGFSQKVRKARITGPSAKFSGQIVGLDHTVKDKDIVEFQTA